jgi:hypothetical protein
MHRGYDFMNLSNEMSIRRCRFSDQTTLVVSAKIREYTSAGQAQFYPGALIWQFFDSYCASTRYSKRRPRGEASYGVISSTDPYVLIWSPWLML